MRVHSKGYIEVFWELSILIGRLILGNILRHIAYTAIAWAFKVASLVKSSFKKMTHSEFRQGTVISEIFGSSVGRNSNSIWSSFDRIVKL